MNRAHARVPIAEALELLPARIRERVQCDYLVGACPVWVGLHDQEVLSNGWPARECAHVAYSCHQEDRPRAGRATTVVLPELADVPTIVHELGHVLDEQIGFRRHDPEPVTRYARCDRWEAFAEAFMLWAVPDLARDLYGEVDWAQVIRPVDERTARLLAELAA